MTGEKNVVYLWGRVDVGLYPHLCSLWEFPLWEKEDLIGAVCLIPHEVLNGVEFGQSPVEVSGLPHALWVTLV